MARGGPNLEEMKNLKLDQFLDKEVDLTQFFNQKELDDMGIHQQTRLKNIAQNYEIMLYMGLPAIKPDFMKSRARKSEEPKRRHVVSHTTTLPPKTTNACSDSDSDETWTPDLERKKRAKENKVYPSFSVAKRRKCNDDITKEKKAKVVTSIMCDSKHPTISLIHPMKNKLLKNLDILPGDNNMIKGVKSTMAADLKLRYTDPNLEDFLLMSSAMDPRFKSLPYLSDVQRQHVFEALHQKTVEINSKKVLKKSSNQTSEKRVYELRERKAVNFMHLEAPDDDHFLYCEECNKEYDMDCPVHGPLEYIKDTEVSSKFDQDRALHTLPPGLVVKTSSIIGAGLGVFTEKEIPSRVMFGPYGGVEVFDEMTAHDSGYCWQIYANGKPSHFVDARDKVNSNWMRYVNCAPSESEQNLVAFQFKGNIYYRSYKTISPGTELLCWYGNEYGRELGLVRDKNLLIRPKLVNGIECYSCVFCKISFTTAVYNVRHLVRMHGKNKLSQTDIQVLDEWLRKNDAEEYSRRRQGKRELSFKVHEHGINNQSGQHSELDMNSNHLHKSMQNTVDEKLWKNNNLYYTDSKAAMFNSKYKMQYFKCDVCDYACTDSSSLKAHKRIHTEEKCFKCDVCDFAFNYQHHLKSHKRIHTGEKCFKCDVCDYACNQIGNLKTHKRIHIGEKCFKCDVCDYACSDCANLKRHKRIHTGEKCFKCDVCDFACNQNGNLKRHKRIHTGEKCFKCDVCDFACNQSGDLKTHKRIHTGEKCFKCDLCDYACNQSCHLKKHKRIHTGEKCFKCDVCDFACNQSSHLKTHKRIHTGEKCFKCDVCDFACNQSSSLKTHKRIHTGEK